MTKEELAVHMDGLFEDLRKLRQAGQAEYAGGEEAFGNFNRLANLLKTDRKKILLTYSMKHMDGIFSFVNGHKSQRESVHGRIRDKIMYLIILDAMITEEEAAEDMPGKGHYPEKDDIGYYPGKVVISER